MKVLFDTNILIDHLNGVPQARAELARYAAKAISIVTFMEVLIGAPDAVEAETRAFLAGFTVLELDDAVAARAVAIRRTRRIKLPDAIIRATADVHSLLLVTHDTRDFPEGAASGVRVPYTL